MCKANWILLTTILLLGATSAHSELGEGRTQINAESGNYDLRLGAYHLKDNVRISRDGLVVEADEGYAYSADGGWDRVELFGTPTTWSTVLEDGGETVGSSDQVIYDFNANLITMIGNAQIRDGKGSFTGARITYNLETEMIEGEGGVELVIEPGAGDRRVRSVTEPPRETPPPEREPDNNAPEPRG